MFTLEEETGAGLVADFDAARYGQAFPVVGMPTQAWAWHPADFLDLITYAPPRAFSRLRSSLTANSSPRTT